MRDTEAVETPEAEAALESLTSDLEALWNRITEGEAEVAHLLEGVHPDHIPSAKNLVHYMALRRYDVRDLQERLASAGLSSLGRSEPHVLVTIDRVISMLERTRGSDSEAATDDPVGFREGERLLRENAERLL